MASTKFDSPANAQNATTKAAHGAVGPAKQQQPALVSQQRTFAASGLWPQPWRGSGGAALPAELQQGLVSTMGERASVSARVHTDRFADLVARSWDARAVTVGENIYFGFGEYQPGTRAGDLLIAHEVAHVDQAQQGLLRRPAAKKKGGASEEATEAHADARAQAATANPSSTNAPDASAAADKAPVADQGGGKKQAVDNGEAPEAKGAAEKAPALPADPGAVPSAAGSGAATQATDGVLIPEPPLELSAAEKGRLHQVEGQAAAATEKQTDVPAPEAEVKTAREAVAEPTEEAMGKAASEAVKAVDDRPPPSPEILALCERIRKVIRDKRPPDEDSLVKAKPEEMAKEAGREQNQAIKKDVDKVSGSYDDVKKTPEGKPAPPPGAMTETPATVAQTPIKAQQASPDAVPAKQVSLDADVKAGEQQMDDAGMNSEPAQLVEDGPIAAARGAQDELSEMAKRDPVQVLADQQAALGQAKSDMSNLQAEAQQMLASSRRDHVGAAKTKKSGMKLTEEQQRRQAGKDAEATFKTAQDQVNKLLDPLPDTAMKKWDAGVNVLSTQFKQKLQKVENWIKERHSGVGGAFVAAWDYVTGLPRWVTEEYDVAEKAFGDGVTDLIIDISRDVNAVIKACEGIIETARRDIAEIYSKLPESLKNWAEGEQARFGQQLNELTDKAHSTRDKFNQDLVNRASQAVQDARQEIHDLREAAKGLIDKLKDAIGEFLADPVRFIINGLLKLVGISPSAFWGIVAKVQQVAKDIADDPIKFINNLVAGVGRGFSQFFDNFGKHLLAGFLDWLFSALRKDGAGVEVPADLSAKSIVKFVLQLLGISWPRVRKLLVEQLGEKTVMVLETAAGLIATLVTEGIDGVAKLIKERLDPKTIIDAMIEAGIRYLVETVAVKVAAKILSMLNPAGAILQAITLIYDVLKWVFTNASRIFSFVEAVVNGMADVIAGNIAGLANSVEKALAMLVPICIALFAQILGLDGLPRKVANAVKGIHGSVEAALRAAVKWLVDQAKKLLAKLGIGGKDKDKDKKPPGDVGTMVPFNLAGKSHHLMIKVQGKNAKLMVASNPTPFDAWISTKEVQEKLGQLRNAAKGDEKAKENYQKADALIKEATGLAKAVGKDAETVLAAQTEPAAGANGGGAAVAEQKVESEERSLATVLQELGDLLDLKVPLEVRFAKEIERMAAGARGYAIDRLKAEPDAVKANDWEEVKQWLRDQTGFVQILGEASRVGSDTVPVAREGATKAVTKAADGDPTPTLTEDVKEIVDRSKPKVNDKQPPYGAFNLVLTEFVFSRNGRGAAETEATSAYDISQSPDTKFVLAKLPPNDEGLLDDYDKTVLPLITGGKVRGNAEGLRNQFEGTLRAKRYMFAAGFRLQMQQVLIAAKQRLANKYPQLSGVEIYLANKRRADYTQRKSAEENTHIIHEVKNWSGFDAKDATEQAEIIKSFDTQARAYLSSDEAADGELKIGGLFVQVKGGVPKKLESVRTALASFAKSKGKVFKMEAL